MATATRRLQDTQKASADSRNPPRATSLSWLRKLRQDGFARFSETGFPTTRDEDWRFTNPSAIAQTPFHLVRNGHSLPSQKDIEQFRMPGAACQLVFVDGRFAPGLSSIGKLPAGVTVGNLAAEIARNPGSD